MRCFNYINEEYTKSLLGNRFPLGIKRLCKLLNQYLNFLDDNGDTLPSELLYHNISKDRNRAISEFAKLDADMVVEVDNISKTLKVDLRDYRIHKEFARDLEEKRVVLHILITDANNTKWAIHLPLQSLMVGFGNPMEGYHCYGHGISFLNTDGTPQNDEIFYCGITKRGWLKRMTEHFREISNGSNKTFHRRWREYLGNSNVLLNSELVALNHSFEAAMHWEEWIVEKYLEQNKSLNMIPGGFAGLNAFSKQSSILKTKFDRSAVRGATSFLSFTNQSRQGMLNPMIKQLWLDDRYYAKVIGNRSNTISNADLIKIRSLGEEGYNVKYISENLNNLDMRRIRNVLTGKTYKRM